MGLTPSIQAQSPRIAGAMVASEMSGTVYVAVSTAPGGVEPFAGFAPGVLRVDRPSPGLSNATSQRILSRDGISGLAVDAGSPTNRRLIVSSFDGGVASLSIGADDRATPEFVQVANLGREAQPMGVTTSHGNIFLAVGDGVAVIRPNGKVTTVPVFAGPGLRPTGVAVGGADEDRLFVTLGTVLSTGARDTTGPGAVVQMQAGCGEM